MKPNFLCEVGRDCSGQGHKAAAPDSWSPSLLPPSSPPLRDYSQCENGKGFWLSVGKAEVPEGQGLTQARTPSRSGNHSRCWRNPFFQASVRSPAGHCSCMGVWGACGGLAAGRSQLGPGRAAGAKGQDLCLQCPGLTSTCPDPAQLQWSPCGDAAWTPLPGAPPNLSLPQEWDFLKTGKKHTKYTILIIFGCTPQQLTMFTLFHKSPPNFFILRQ